MKTPIALALAFLAVVPSQAQIFRPEAASGAFGGGIAGAIIGRNSGSLHHSGQLPSEFSRDVTMVVGDATHDTVVFFSQSSR
jgi:hypothetical protein